MTPPHPPDEIDNHIAPPGQQRAIVIGKLLGNNTAAELAAALGRPTRAPARYRDPVSTAADHWRGRQAAGYDRP